MELPGIQMENFPPIVGNSSKTLRKLSLLEARMIGAGNESPDGSLPPNDGSRGSENNSNSLSTIGFAKPRTNVSSPGDGGGSGSRPRSEPGRDEGVGTKRKVPTEDRLSPARQSPQSRNAETPSTLSTSPGESRGWNDARISSHSVGEGAPGIKRQCHGRTLQRPPLPPPPRQHSLPQGGGDRQVPQRAATGGTLGTTKGVPNPQRRGPRGKDGTGSPYDPHASGRAGHRQPSDRSAQGRDPSHGPKHSQQHSRTSDAHARGGVALVPPPAPALGSFQGGGEMSPAGDGKILKAGGGGGQGGPGGSTKTIQSYFYRPSSASAVQNLALSYGAGDAIGQSYARGGGGSPGEEVDLSGIDGDSKNGHVEPVNFAQPQAQTVSKVGRTGSAGGMGSNGGGGTGNGGAGDVGSLQHSSVALEKEQDQAISRRRGENGGGGIAGREGLQRGLSERDEGGDALAARLREAEVQVARLKRELDRAHLERSSMESMTDALRKQLDSKIEEFKAKEVDRDVQKAQLTSAVENLLRKVAAQEASDCRAKLARDTLELGKIVSVKTGQIGRYAEAFEEGSSFKEVEERTAAVAAKRGKLEARKRAVARLLKSTTPAAGDEDAVSPGRLEAVEEEESVRMHLAALKREEIALQEEKRTLDTRKVLHIRELKRVAHEDRSKFAKRPTLTGRYVLLNLLGKGGFSEVWRAFDLVRAEDVAVKVHQLLNNWNEPQKANFIRHVTREYEIHQQMRHPRIVNLTDVFEICCDSFATVLDYCRGTDLECLLRERKQLPERDARALILQVARGLQYLNTAQARTHCFTGEGENKRGAIIHYDLKPGNILLDENGDVKITDFGLSKAGPPLILEIKKDTERGTGGGTSMELTSKGAGTYWYLPPECFGDNPRISSKVDVWSLGVVFYQMLYGIRPFGEGLSQEKILREKVIVNANRVEFPPKPVVSEEAKSFIRSCLTYTHATRPDVHAMCNLPYLAATSQKRGA
ncbi:unnamed protein product [Ascophyllum nodosum]